MTASPAKDATTDADRVQHAAEKFESLFIGEMLKQMRRTTEAFAAEDSPSKSQINQDMLAIADTAVADALAQQRAFGIADAIVRQLLPEPMKPDSVKNDRPPLHEAAGPVASTD
ncbi:MAG: rod-binding protein [Aquabacterium sp.]